MFVSVAIVGQPAKGLADLNEGTSLRTILRRAGITNVGYGQDVIVNGSKAYDLDTPVRTPIGKEVATVTLGVGNVKGGQEQVRIMSAGGNAQTMGYEPGLHSVRSLWSAAGWNIPAGAAFTIDGTPASADTLVPSGARMIVMTANVKGAQLR
jgi:hypothetical protein